MRGEYPDGPLGGGQNMELPPHARRIRQVGAWNQRGIGTTSACAENTPQVTPLYSPHGNYLRMRGEYFLTGVALTAKGELPPHARRIRCMIWRLEGGLGTTSACAENTAP